MHDRRGAITTDQARAIIDDRQKRINGIIIKKDSIEGNQRGEGGESLPSKKLVDDLAHTRILASAAGTPRRVGGSTRDFALHHGRSERVFEKYQAGSSRLSMRRRLATLIMVSDICTAYS